MFLRIFAPLIAGTGLLALSAVINAQELQLTNAHEKLMVREQIVDAVIEAVNQTTVSAQTSGRVETVNVDVDDYVEKGAVLLSIRDNDQRAALKAATAAASEARANFERVRDLLKKKLVSKSDYDKAESATKSAAAAQEQAQEQLDNTKVRAPYSGIVVKRLIQPGETVNPGTPLMTGISLEKLRAIASVPQNRINHVRKLSSARVIIDEEDGSRSINGDKITFTPYADAATHTFKVRVDLPPGSHGLYPGVYTKVAFATGEQHWLVVPQASVVQRSEVTGIYVVSDGLVGFRHIRTGQKFADGSVAVLAGLDNGEQVAVDPIKAGVLLKQQRQGDQ